MSIIYVVLNPMITIFMGLWIEPVRDLLPFIIELRSRPRRDVNRLLTLAGDNLYSC